MKTTPLVILAALASAAVIRSQETDTAVSREPSIAPIATTARIIGNIPDGTPPPPAPPKPEFVVPNRDILATTTHEQGGRTITIQRIKPIDLPPPPEPAAEPPALTEEFKQCLAAYRAAHPRVETITLGATVYRSKNTPPRTLVRYWPGNGAGTISFWSSADFALISGIHSFTGIDGKPRSLFMIWSSIDTDRIATRRINYQLPEIPTFSEEKATYQIISGQPTPEQLIPIQSLHDLYNTEHGRLLTALQGREQAQLAREAELKANPPLPQDITIQYWRTESPAAAKGGDH